LTGGAARAQREDDTMATLTAEDTLDHLKSLHAAAVDSRDGYEAAVEDAEGHGLTPLFTKMTGLHQHHADELAAALHGAGEPADDDGSFMSTVHRTVMDVRALFGGLDDSVLPGLIDGETRNIAAYDKALDETGLPPDIRALLTRQRDALQAAIRAMDTDQA
jgi:uncharacterized protein (TIGR02284 family)